VARIGRRDDSENLRDGEEADELRGDELRGDELRGE
jgi:hypothetical protein